jgi:hypothetical protein
VALSLARTTRPLRQSDWAFVALAALAFVVALAAGHGLTFYWDEWAFISSGDDWSLNAFLRPHNEHWSTGALLIFKPLFAIFGLRSYVPYQIALVALHVVVAGALFVLVRREAGAHVGLLSGALFLFLGSGGANLIWPALIGWNVAAASGAWALVFALEPNRMRRPWLIALLLIISVAASGVGLAFLAAVAVVALTTAERRRQMWVIAPAVAAYGAWFALYGRSAISASALSLTTLRDLPAYVAAGVGNAMGRVTGWGDEPGLVLAVLVAVATAWRLLSAGPLMIGALAAVVGLLAQFFITGIARAQLGPDQAAAAHYVYVAAFFLLLLIGSWLSLLRIGGVRRQQLVVLAALTVFALGANLAALAYSRSSFLAAANETRAAITVLTRFGGTPGIPADRGIFPEPGSAQLNAIFARHGSPLSDVLAPAPAPTTDALDRALFQAVKPDLTVKPSELPTGTTAPEITKVTDAKTAERDGCLVATATGASPQISGSVAGGAELYIRSSTGGAGRLLMSHFGAPIDQAGIDVALYPGRYAALQVPDIGPSARWSFRIDAPAGETWVCVG